MPDSTPVGWLAQYSPLSAYSKRRIAKCPKDALDRQHRRQTGTILGLKTYIVEDNATIRENLIGTLEELAGIQVVGMADAESEGTRWLRACADQWSLVIVDLFLKQGSGLGVLAACRERAAHQRVVVLSNYATSDIRARCTQLGADAVFDKSNEIDALVDYCLQQGKSQPNADIRPGSSNTHGR